MGDHGDDALEVLRAVWAVDEAARAELDEECGPTKSCKNMKDVTFDGYAEPGDGPERRVEGTAGPGGQVGRLRGQHPRPGPRVLRAPLTADLSGGVRSRPMERPSDVTALTELLRGGGYLADRGLATALHVSLSLGRPLLLEGEVGVGKTEVAKALASVSGRRLIRLQCYEGIDTSQALYDWDYARQMLQIRGAVRT